MERTERSGKDSKAIGDKKYNFIDTQKVIQSSSEDVRKNFKKPRSAKNLKFA
jgi:hypothetical protein